MNSRYSLVAFLIGSILAPTITYSVASEFYPEEFKDFFAKKNELVQVHIAGVIAAVKISGFVNYDSFQLTQITERQKLQQNAF